MKIAPIADSRTVSFKRRLSSAEEREMSDAVSRAKELLGNTGNSVLIVHDACLPQSVADNTGVGNLLGEESDRFFRFAKTYLGINAVEMLPQGEFVRKNSEGFVCAYGYSALGLNNGLINPNELTKSEWGCIVTPAEVREIVAENSGIDNTTLVNYKNINDPKSKFQLTLKKAYKRFLALDEKHPLRQDFVAYRHDNADWLEPKVVYSILKRKNNGLEYEEWNIAERNLYNPDFVNIDTRKTRVSQLLEANKGELDFFAFKQFMAEKHLQAGRENLHAQGLKLFGDMAITFSKDEVWANPKAFLQTHYIGANDWKAPCLNFSQISNENSASAQLLKRKVGLMARRYDGIRFDVSWMYVKPKMFNKMFNRWERIDLGDTVLKLLEAEVERVQGVNFDRENLIHEFKAGGEDFVMINGGMPHSALENRVTILESEYMNGSWGSNHYYSEVINLPKDSYIMGLGDHTSQPLVQIALGMRDRVDEAKNGGQMLRRNIQIPVLADIFGDTVENISRPTEFIRAKFADIMDAKHNFMFYLDPLGRSTRFDAQGLNSSINYRAKISPDFVADYHARLKKGFALNLPDVLAKAFERRGLNLSQKDLYDKLQNFAKILKEPETIKETKNNAENGVKYALKWKYAIWASSIVALVGALGYIFTSKRRADIVDTSR